MRAYVEQHRRDYGLPGLTLCLVDVNGYAAFITSGWADVDRREPVGPEHLFQIGSISKSLTALSVFRAVQAGKLRLADDIRQALPGVDLGSDEPVRLQHLLNHTSGLPDDPPMFPRVTGGKLWIGYRPGSHWSYSNTGYDMLGKVLERALGRAFEDVVASQVLAPLGMSRARGAIRQEDRARYATGYSPYLRSYPYLQGDQLTVAPWVDVTFAAGSVAATSADMARYLRWLIAAGQGRGAPLLSDELARQWATSTTEAPAWAPGAGYANGMAVVKSYGRTLLHHTGGMVAFSSSLHVDAQAGLACFASTNMGMTGYRPRDITAYACELFRTARDGGPAPKPKPTVPVIDDAAKYAGRFQAAGGDWVELRPQGGGLRLVSQRGEAALEPSGENQFSTRLHGFERYPLLAEMHAGKLRAIWSGDVEYAADPATLRGPAPEPLRALTGRYDNDDPWNGTIRVVARPTGLFLDGVNPLTALPDGSWRAGADDWSSERVWFDAALAGRPQRLSFSGLDFLRREDRA